MEFFICVFIVTSFVTQSFQYENLAFGKPVTVSKRYNYINFDPSLAVDGDASTDLLKCSLTASGDKEAWLTVDLGDVKNIASISFLHGGLGLNAQPMDPGYTDIYPVLSGNGSLQHSWDTDKKYTVCTSLFTYENAEVVCLDWGYLPDNPVRYRVPLQSNLSYSSTYYRCIGNETVLRKCKLGYLSSGCSNQGGEQIGISCEKGDTLAGFSVYVSDTPDWRLGSLCYQHDINKYVDNNVSIDCFTTGRYVTIYNSRKSPLHSTLSSFAYINICEVNVTGCNIGHYGDDCLECPSHCINNTCQMQVGHCFDCEDGYTGPMCEKVCPASQYGKHCSFRCGSCLNEEPCQHINGTCISGCSPGWKGDYCDQICDSGYFGSGCNSTCNNSNCMNSTSCEPSSGQCSSGCLRNWSGLFCQDCVPTYYGEHCNISCSKHCQKKLCNQTTGHCFSCTINRSGVFCENEITLVKAAASFDSNAGFIVTSALLGVFMIVTLVYVVKRKWFSSSTQTFEQNYELPASPKLTFEYEEIQSKNTGGEIDKNVSEYSEIAVVETNMSRTEYSNIL